VTVRAELVGDYSHEPPRDYTGVTLGTILERAKVREAASVVRVVGVDGYGVSLDFDLGEVMDPATAEGFLLVEEHGRLKWGGTGDYYRLVCRDLEGGWWVRWVVSITVE
jgi:DMSO/TMAO reductase YedYZ molybdopterin-dependent catalytic subunit